MNQTAPDRADEVFEGLALHDHLPLAWEPAPLADPADLERHNFATARALAALALFEEAPRDSAPDGLQQGHELQHLEAKVDVLLSLVTQLLAERHGYPPRHNVVLRADGIEWSGPATEAATSGATGVVVLYPNATLPLPFRLPAQVVASIDRSGRRWLVARFEYLSPAVRLGLEKLVFRHHRRQVALARATDTLSRTGILRAPKL